MAVNIGAFHLEQEPENIFLTKYLLQDNYALLAEPIFGHTQPTLTFNQNSARQNRHSSLHTVPYRIAHGHWRANETLER